MKPKKIRLDQIVARRTKGYAFSGGTYQERVAYRQRVEAEIRADYASMSEDAFREKYDQYIY